MDFAFVVFLVLLVVLYKDLAKRLYQRWKISRQKKKDLTPLLGVIYPTEKNDSKDN